jgi:Tfp pilus assembly protein PilF
MPSEETDLHARALDELLRGDTAGAISDLKEHLAREPEDDAAWLALGTAYATIGHTIQAADAIRTSIDLDGSVVDARLAYARLLVKLGKLDDAAFQLLQATKLAPEDARVLAELGIVFYDKRLYDKAAVWLAKATAAAPGDARAFYALGLAHEARRDVAASLASLREAIRLEPGHLDARRTLADALAGVGEHEEAIAELEAVLARAPSDEQAAHNREVLVHALAEMREHRLLGKTEQELDRSALVQQGQLKRKGQIPAEKEGGLAFRYGAPLVELFVTYAPDRTIEQLMLLLTDPDRAARAVDDLFEVTVVASDGRRVPADFGTGVSLTFLREALGCPMTAASTLYARLLAAGEGRAESVDWGGATMSFASVPRPDKPALERHGLVVRAK